MKLEFSIEFHIRAYADMANLATNDYDYGA